MRYTNEIIANRDTKRNINTQKQASIFHQPAFIVMTTQGSSSLVRVFLRHLFEKVSNIKGLRAVKRQYLPLIIE